jgi:DeoR family transcriptional regulator, glycerol-3-phosphate regulon repressor
MSLERVRHEHILIRLTSNKKVSVASLAEELGVSMETVRRDLKAMEDHGQLRRIHGGAVPVVGEQDRPLHERTRMAAKEKSRIAALALPLLKAGMTVFLDTGTTTLALARELSRVAQLTVFTNSLDVALVVSQQNRHRIRAVSGELRSNDNALLGYDTLDAVRKYTFDIALMGIAAVHPDAGLMDYEDHEAELRRVLVQQARSSVIVADYSKLGKKARIHTLPLRAIDILVTNAKPSDAVSSALQNAEVELIHG